jgi:hypothetical protein
MTKALVRSTSPERALTAQGPAPVKTLGEIIARLPSGHVSPRQAKRLSTTLRHVEDVSASLTRIARDCNQMTADAAACARTVAQCEADIAALAAAQEQSATARAEAAERARHLRKVVEQEMRVRGLTAEVRAEELADRLAALKAARPARTETSTARRETAPPPSPWSVGDTALLARLSSEADAILREVQGGLVPTDARHPYHAFAACVYLRAKLDGHDATAAAAQAGGELVAHMRDDREFTPGERKAFRREYDDLKKRLDDRSETRQGAALLSMMKHVGAASGPSNNGRGVQ